MEYKIGIYIPKPQIDSLKSGNIFTTCEPRERIEKIAPYLITSRLSSIGQVFEVADEGGSAHTRAKLIDCFITTFGSPDLKFVSGMGFGADVAKCKFEYEKFWKINFPTDELSEATELFVTVWEPVK